MKLFTFSQFMVAGNYAAVFILSAALVWIAINIVRYFVAGNYHDKSHGGMSILRGCITLYATLVIWGILTLIKNHL